MEKSVEGGRRGKKKRRQGSKNAKDVEKAEGKNNGKEIVLMNMRARKGRPRNITEDEGEEGERL